MTISEKIYKIRTDTGLSQKEFAEKAGVSQSAINYWENGKRQPKTDQIKKIAKAFDVALYVLVDDKYELDNVSSEAYKNKARFLGDTEMEKFPAPFTSPVNNNHNTIIIDTTIDKSNPVYAIQKKVENGEKLSPEETVLYNLYIKKGITAIKQSIENFSESLKQSYLQYYVLLNEEGIKEADKQIANVVKRETKQIQEQLKEQMELLTKVPEYRKILSNETLNPKTAAPER